MAVPPQDPYAKRNGGSKLALTLGGVALCLMVGFGIGSGQGLNGLLSLFGKKPVDPTLVGAAQKPSRVQAIGSQPSASTQLGFEPRNPTVQAVDKMPFEVRAWLKHLEETEKRRKALATKQLASLLSQSATAGAASLQDLMSEANGEEPVTTDTSKRDQVESSAMSGRDEWQGLEQFFNSKRPPTDCLSTKNAYEQCLGETGAMVTEVLDHLASSRSDPQTAIQRLTEMMGTSQGRVDEAAKQTDSLVSAICNRYETVKWFSVSGDFGGGLGGLGSIAGFGF